MGDVEHVTIYTASSVPAAASHPTINCLQWTEDGQLLFLTKTAVYVLTPDLGINYCDPSAVSASKLRHTSPGATSLGWFRTVLELDRRSFHHWPSESQDWDTLVTGSLDISIKSVVSSPSFLSADAGCVLAIVSTNFELSLWCSVKNQLAGQWTKLQDATPYLRSLAVAQTDSRLQQTLRTQVVCSSWSRQPDFGAVPPCVRDGSLLALGNRAGSILLLRFTKESGSGRYLEHIRTIDVSEQWITHLTWLPWANTVANECVAILVYCTSDGAVGFVKVTRTCHIEAGTSWSDPKSVLATSASPSRFSICEPDDRVIMGLSFIELRNMKPVVIVFRPGVLQLWRDECDGCVWSGLRSLFLHRQGISSGSSMFYPPSGLVYTPEHDVIVLSLFDGSFHVLYDISSSPTVNPHLDSTRQSGFSSSDLSSVCRRIFIQIEGGTIPQEMNRINGMVSFGGFPIVCWAHERSMSSDFSYKHEARHNSTLVVTRMYAEDSDDAVLKMLDDDGVLSRLHSPLLRVLQDPVGGDLMELAILPQLGDSSSSSYALFRENITRQLFGSDVLLQLRLKLTITDFCWRSATSPETRNEYGAVARGLLSAVSYRVLGALVRHIDTVVHLLTQDDLPFVLRVVIQCMLPDAPQELSTEAQNLANKVTTSFPTAKREGAAGGLQEQCPACGVEVPFEDIAAAACPNGHRWSRCSVTSFILSTTMVRTCLGCARKAFLHTAPYPHLLEREKEFIPGMEASERTTGRGWVVQELLEAVRRCLFCGNNFVTLI
ncbi:putative zinc-finger of transcription factor IIIC complex-domain-containing protein [Lactifluus subvellereus]|nr:putative zinc-finger of transcription factor IIIC complex-domain-containing protein [Lactifluus subvellereus]